MKNKLLFFLCVFLLKTSFASTQSAHASAMPASPSAAAHAKSGEEGKIPGEIRKGSENPAIVKTSFKPSAIAISGDFAIIAHAYSKNITVFKIDWTTGKFTQVVGSPFPYQISLSPLPTAVAILNDIVIVTELYKPLALFKIDFTTGKLTQIDMASNKIFTVGSHDPNLIFIIPNNQSLAINIFQKNLATKELAKKIEFIMSTVAPKTVFADDIIATWDHLKRDDGSSENAIRVYKFDKKTGKLPQVPGSPFHRTIAEASPIAIANAIAVVPNTRDNTLSIYEIDQETGTFTPITGETLKVNKKK